MKTKDEFLMEKYNACYASIQPGQIFPRMPESWVLEAMEEYSNQQNEELLEALRETVQQIEYLNNKFQKTGTSESVLSRMTTLLSKYEIN